jgi:TPP-dependent pyruvate/acetoin dehydrogenase alpha subunit
MATDGLRNRRGYKPTSDVEQMTEEDPNEIGGKMNQIEVHFNKEQMEQLRRQIEETIVKQIEETMKKQISEVSVTWKRK